MSNHKIEEAHIFSPRKSPAESLLQSIEVKVGEIYMITPTFLHSQKRTNLLTRKVLLIEIWKYDEPDQDENRLEYYVVEELTDGPETDYTKSGRLWTVGEQFTLSQMSWKFQHIENEN